MGKVKISISIDEELLEILKSKAPYYDRNLSSYINKVLKDVLIKKQTATDEN